MSNEVDDDQTRHGERRGSAASPPRFERTAAFMRGVREGLARHWLVHLFAPAIGQAQPEAEVHWLLRALGAALGAEGPRVALAALRGRFSVYRSAFVGLVAAARSLAARRRASQVGVAEASEP